MSTVSVARRIEQDLDAGLSTYEKWRMSIRFGSSLIAASLFVVGLSIVQFAPIEQAMFGRTLQAAAALLVLAPIFCEALIGIFHESSEYYSAQLVSIAALAAFAVGDFTTAVIVPVVLSVAFFLEERSVLGAQSAIQGLQALQSNSARRIGSNGQEMVVPAAELKIDDEVIVGPGENVPADGRVVHGHSAVDQSSMTGESTPEEVEPGHRVFAGSVNLNGVLRVRVESAGEDTTLAKILELFQQAEQSKTQVLRLVEHYAKYFVLGILLIAGISLFLTHDVTRAITVLVVGCPGPFLIAGPAAMVASLAVASRQGILIKNAKFLEALSDINDVVFDKTGTVTTGKLEVRQIVAFEENQESLLAMLIAGTASNQHPVAKAVTNHAKSLGIESNLDAEVEEVPGRGIRIKTDTQEIFLGRKTWLQSVEFCLPEDPEHAGPMVWMGRIDAAGHHVCGVILLADHPREDAAQVVGQLQSLGVERTVLLTGDRASVADDVAQSVGITNVIAEVLPSEKLEVVQLERNAGYHVLVVGDGVNDAPALAAGSIGVAMGVGGADITMRSADIVLMSHQLDRLPFAVMLARKTKRTIHQNVLIGAALTLGMLLMASAGAITPIAGAILQNVGEAFVILNSAAILRWRCKLPEFTTTNPKPQANIAQPVAV